MLKKEIVIFTDGASKGNPGPGGWGSVVSMNGKVFELGGARGKTTNNEMELTALKESLDFLGETKKNVHVYIDSKYVINGVTSWLAKWKLQDWITTSKKPVTHKDLWQQVDVLVEKYAPVLEYIPGHSGVNGNEKVDVIAQSFAEGKKMKLFAGTIEDYSVDLNDLTKKNIGASDKKKRSRAKAYSYVSCVGGVTQTHQIWSECEKRVKGTKGARFKKVFSKSEEIDLIKEYSNIKN